MANSSEIIGAIVDTLRLDDGFLTSRTAKRFFQDQLISEKNQVKVFLEIGEVLVGSGLVPEPPVFKSLDVSMAVFVGVSIARVASRWDNAIARLQTASTTKGNPGATVERLLRLVTIDLAVRVFAILRLAGMEPNSHRTPLWAQENGGDKFLRQLAARAGVTREDLATQLGAFTTSSVDNWFDGKVRPTNDSIVAISEALASGIEDATPDGLALDIQRQFTFAAIADLLVPWIGRDKVVELSAALTRFVWLMAEDIRQMDRPPIEEALGVELDFVRFGTSSHEARTLLKNLSVVEPNEDWRRDLLAATPDWGMLFEKAVAEANPYRSSAGLAQEIEDVKPVESDQTGLDPSGDDPTREAISRLGDRENDLARHLATGRIVSPGKILKDGIESRRAIAATFPRSPLAHSELGAFLGMAGKTLSRRDLIDEGLTECVIASQLLQGWDMPAVEQGIILANFGAFDEALERLERVRESLPEETPHFCSAIGYVLMELGRFPEALGYLERALGVRPNDAEANRHAAHCSLMMGDHWTGQRYAKTARRLGKPDVFIAWKNGWYRSRKMR